MLELIVIANENNIDIEDPMLRYKLEKNSEGGHLSACKEFVSDYNLDIQDIDELTSYEISLKIAKMGHVSIHVEGMNMIIYLPKILSDKQYKWFKDNRRLLSRFSLSITSICENDDIKYIENNEYEMKSSINRLYRELKKKELLKKKYILEEENDIKKM